MSGNVILGLALAIALGQITSAVVLGLINSGLRAYYFKRDAAKRAKMQEEYEKTIMGLLNRASLEPSPLEDEDDGDQTIN